MNVNEHQSLWAYRDQMTRIIASMFPGVEYSDIQRGVEYSINKRFTNFDLSVQNNYTNQYVEMTMLDMIDYIQKRQPIVTSYGTMFKKHGDVPNPMARVIDGFLNLRSQHKKEMFKYPKNSEMFEHFNLLQALDKIDVNGIYG